MEPGLNTIEVRDQSGKRVDRADVSLADESKKAVVNVEQLSPGTYTVQWKALSADQHAMRGTFRFSVSQAAAASTTVTPSPSQALPSPAPTSQMETSEINDTGDKIGWRQTLVRWVSYLSMMILFGGFGFKLFVLTPAVGASLEGGDKNKLLELGSRRVIAISWVGAILLLVTSILALGLQAADVFDKSFPSSFSPTVLVQALRTGYGPSWLLQIVSLSVLILVLVLISKARKVTRIHSISWWVGLVAAMFLLLAPSWTGHAMLSALHFRLAVITDWLHLVAAGFWVGGLFHLAVNAKPVVSATSPEQRRGLLHYLIRSFTRIAIPSVVLLFLAGLYNTWAHVPAIRALWRTPYGRVLGVKLLVVLLMLLLGAVNNYYFGKRAARLADESDIKADADGRLEHSFWRSVRFEAALGVVVLFVTAVLVFLTPARDHPAMDQARSAEAFDVVGKNVR